MPSDSRDRSAPKPAERPADELAQARRRFLQQCGRFAAATPPAVTLLLAAAERNYATAGSSTSGGGGVRTDYDNGAWIVRYPDGSYTFGRGDDGSAPPGIPPGHYSPTP